MNPGAVVAEIDAAGMAGVVGGGEDATDSQARWRLNRSTVRGQQAMIAPILLTGAALAPEDALAAAAFGPLPVARSALVRVPDCGDDVVVFQLQLQTALSEDQEDLQLVFDPVAAYLACPAPELIVGLGEPVLLGDDRQAQTSVLLLSALDELKGGWLPGLAGIVCEQQPRRGRG